jgi:predicted dehydrogenase
MIRVGIIGCGDMGRIHTECLLILPEVKVTAFNDTTHQNAINFADKYNGVAYKEVEDLLKKSDIDCVYICTRHDSHVELIEKTLYYNKAIFCEKPLALTLRESRYITEIIKKSGKPFMIGFNQRFSPAVLALKKYLYNSSEKPTIINLSMSCVNFLDEWMGKPEQGGGILISLLCHVFDLLRFIMEDEIECVSCIADRLRLGEDYMEDCGAVICKFKCKAIANAIFHDHGHPGYVMDPLKEMVRLELHTGKKSIVSYAHDKLIICDSEGIRIEQFGPYSQLYSWGYKEINWQFIESLKNRTRPIPNEDDGLQAAMLIDIARKSIESGGLIKT